MPTQTRAAKPLIITTSGLILRNPQIDRGCMEIYVKDPGR